MFRAKMILASIGPAEIPIYSVEATYPRFIHAEIMTHRDRARNAASSRAIPWKKKGKHQVKISELPQGARAIGKGQFAEISTDSNETYEYYVPNCMYSMLMNDPVVPIKFGMEQSGMQTGDALTGEKLKEAQRIWLEARDNAIRSADALAELGVHKSLCNRLTEPWMWITVIMTATEWNNFFRLRCHPAAEIHFQKIAGMIRDEINLVKEKKSWKVLNRGEWHLPYYTTMDDEEPVLCREHVKLLNQLQDKDSNLLTQADRDSGKSYTEIGKEKAKLISTGRCARLSYLTHEGKRDFLEDIKLGEKLIRPPGEVDEDIMHASPFEHVAEASMTKYERSGPFRGWKQFRKEFINENVEGS